MTTRLKSLFAITFTALVLYVLYFWPMPGFMGTGIPFTSYVSKDLGPRYLVQGDHLQLLYHFELLNGFFHGDTPWFRNLWEFNLSDAEIPRLIGPYYAPFALPYVLLRSLGCTDALSWNLTQLLSVWAGVFFCYCLARRHGVRPWTALAISVVANAVPYRWVTLSGGSPTGFGMGLLPGVVLGVELAVRDRRVWGGVLGGVCLLACYAIDLHCFLFAALSLPLWGLVALLRTNGTNGGDGGATRWNRRWFGQLFISVLPLAIAGILSLAIAAAVKSGYQSTDVSDGRTWGEIRLCSPDWRSFFDPFFACHMPDQFHMGRMLPALLLVSGVVLLAGVCIWWRSRHSEENGRDALFRGYVFGPLGGLFAGGLLAAAILFSFVLALGVNGPFDGLPLRLVRALVPPFKMVRQPIKVFCLLPALYTSFFAYSVALAASIRSRTGFCVCRAERVWQRAAAVLVAAIVVFSLSGRMYAGICLLPGKNAAYEASAALARGREPAGRALVLPVWPGDSSYSSLYQYHAQRSGLRMLNGYAAVKTGDYLERVFYAFETMTEGECTQAQADALRELGVDVVLLQENAWPSKVSSFPFGYTLRRFLADPRFELLAEEDGVWAFRLKGAEEALPEGKQVPPPVGIVRHFAGPFAKDRMRVRLRAFAGYQQDGAFGWLVRGRFPERVTVYCDSGDGVESNRVVRTLALGQSDAVRLAAIERPPVPPRAFSWLTFPSADGRNSGVELLDVAYVPMQPLAKDRDGTLRLCAADLTHEFGTTVLNEEGEPSALAFKPLRDPVSCAVAGPDRPLPFSAGRYRAELEPDDPHLSLCLPGATELRRNVIEFDYDGTSFANFTIQYDGCEPAQARSILVRPVSGPERSVP